MSTLYVKFLPPAPTPSQYKIRYKRTTDPSYTEVVVTSTGLSPEEFNISGLTSGVDYNVEVQSYCGDGVYAAGYSVISNPMDCRTYIINNTSSSASEDVFYTLCGTTEEIMRTLTPLQSITVCADSDTPPNTVDPHITITPGALCIP
jgi:hypothetical protein